MTFSALLLDKDDAGSVTATMTDLEDERLPDGEVTVDVEYSSLNYKDGMILQGIGGLVRTYPHVPGIDLAGTVAASDSPDFQPGDRVVCTGWRMGEVHWGGYAQRARIPAAWPAKLPDHVSTRQAMAIGTAGFTAMQALVALEAHGLTPGADQQILVTGASGGVGSSALLWGSAMGHRMVASTGRMENADDLRALGAADVIDRAELAEAPGRPLLSERWHGCVDAVGGDTLAHVLAEMAYGGSVAACGLAGGNGLGTTVIPFLLRGVNLLGIDSVMASPQTRQGVNERLGQILADDALSSRLDAMTTEVPLAHVAGLAPRILAGQVKGRSWWPAAEEAQRSNQRSNRRSIQRSSQLGGDEPRGWGPKGQSPLTGRAVVTAPKGVSTVMRASSSTTTGPGWNAAGPPSPTSQLRVRSNDRRASQVPPAAAW